MKLLLRCLLLLCFLPSAGHAAIPLQSLTANSPDWPLPVQTLIFIGALTLLPAALLMMTSFTRIIIVFGLLRGIGTFRPAKPGHARTGTVSDTVCYVTDSRSGLSAGMVAV